MPKSVGGLVLSDNSYKVLSLPFLRKGSDGKPIKTLEEMLWRVPTHVARQEGQWGHDPDQVAAAFRDLMASRCFLPSSPTFTGAGTPLAQLVACFVLPISDDMGRKRSGIFHALRDPALIQQTGGGNGLSLSRLRPKARSSSRPRTTRPARSAS